MVAHQGAVAGEAKQIAYAQRRGAEYVALMAMRLRSRQVICITGSKPACISSADTPRLDMWQLAPLPSVTLIASTLPRK